MSTPRSVRHSSRQALHYQAAANKFRVESGISTEFCSRSGHGKLAEFQRLLDRDITNGDELARRIGVSRNTANRWKKRCSIAESGT